MSANKIFNIKRFYNLLRFDLLMNHKRYLFTAAGITIVLYLIMLWMMSQTWRTLNYSDYTPLFAMSAAFLSILVASVFPDLNNKIKTGDYLLLPASTFEKFASQFLIRVIVLLVFFLIIFKVDAVVAKATFSMLSERVKEGTLVIENFEYSKLIAEFNKLRIMDRFAFSFGVFSIITFLFSTRLFFGKFAVVKTAITGVVLVFLFICVMVILSHIFFPYRVEGFDIYFNDYKVCKDTYNAQIYAYILAFGAWAFMLPIGYFKLKEKQL